MGSVRQDGPSDAVKLRTLKRDRYTCVYCGVTGTDAELEVDHVHPVSKGGSHHIGNLVTACRPCNQKKSDGSLGRHAAQRTGAPPPGPVGLFLHTIDQDGRIHRQAKVLALDGDVALIQLFSWIDGRPTIVETIPKTDLYSQRCRLYSDPDEWVRVADEFNERERCA